MTDEPVPFLLLRLQVKAKRTGKWIDIWPAQFHHFHRLGCEIRIIELSPGDPVDASYQQGYYRGYNDAMHGNEPTEFGEAHDHQ